MPVCVKPTGGRTEIPPTFLFQTALEAQSREPLPGPGVMVLEFWIRSPFTLMSGVALASLATHSSPEESQLKGILTAHLHG